ncbi:ABC transporter permease [Streptomyces antimycoticus]|uniref:ABC transporter permease n=1 Tax=Streptomyces antimycoticus TaxID=68175 RepID=A0ABD5JKH9_9ACTN|nr:MULTISPECIES: ABC transporter permease [Streptomyces]MEE4588953.1 ABC transporter permease [Streptomyces sp. DSM 41602]WJE00743.1 ABC transporter permease [Streptomyces antimycoticus]WTA80520.1 ABC transporter permease [Streptomyces antimycoticus]WTB09318.1 ABC transporter permease [Streptomyces antimycoticus]
MTTDPIRALPTDDFASQATPSRVGRAGGRQLGAFILRRLARLAYSVVALATVAFLMIRLIPGDPVRNALGINATAAVVERQRESLGLNDPLWMQYLDFWKGLLTWDLGDSFSLHLPVTTVIEQRLPATLELTFLSLAVVLLVSVPLGILAAAFTRGGRRQFIDVAYTTMSGLLAVIPEFLIGVALVYLFAVQSHVFPVAGRAGPSSYVLPVLALSIGTAAAVSRIVRVEALTVFQQDYMRTARSKRMPRRRLYFRHALPNLMTSSLTIAGIVLASLVAGTVLTETIFSWPGLGLTIVDAVRSKDFPLAQGIVIVYGLIVLVANLIIDIALVCLDPRSALKDT